jgi:hypothetical protein
MRLGGVVLLNHLAYFLKWDGFNLCQINGHALSQEQSASYVPQRSAIVWPLEHYMPDY